MKVITFKAKVTSPHIRVVVPVGAGGAMAPPDFVRSVNPISTRGDKSFHRMWRGFA